MSAPRRALVGGLLAACHSPTIDVLVPSSPASEPDGGEHVDAGDAGTSDVTTVYTSCDAVWALAQPYDRCEDLDDGCLRELDECWVEAYFCEGGLLYPYSENTCQCEDDVDCGEGFYCIENSCYACDADPPCDPCAEGHEFVYRNGCQTCECAPSAQCAEPSPEGCARACASNPCAKE